MGEADRRQALERRAQEAAPRQPRRGHARAGRRPPRSAQGARGCSSRFRAAGTTAIAARDPHRELEGRTGFIAELARDWEAEAMRRPTWGSASCCCGTASCCRRRRASCTRSCRRSGWGWAVRPAAARSGCRGSTSRINWA
jgi:hypothetical protein